MDNAPIRRVHTWETEIKAFPFRHPKSSASKPQREYVHVDYTSTVPQLIGPAPDGTTEHSQTLNLDFAQLNFSSEPSFAR